MRIDLKAKAWVAVAVVLMASAMGCTSPQVNQVLQEIANQIPTAIAIADTVGPLVATVDPAVAPLVGVAVMAVNAGLPLLQADINAYLANPNASILARIEAAINNIITQNTAALQAVGIKNGGKQTAILAALGSLNAVLIVIDGYIQQIQSNSTTKANAAARTVKLSQVDKYLDHSILNQVAQNNGTTYAAFYAHETALGF
jgi:hypothetical protein